MEAQRAWKREDRKAQRERPGARAWESGGEAGFRGRSSRIDGRIQTLKRPGGKGDEMGRRICRTLSVLILMAVVAICIPMTVPRLMGYDVYVVVSGSMEPEIPVGSALYVAAVVPEDVAEGDVIAFYDRGAVITHRELENHVVEGEFITKGDANEERDLAPVPYASLIGRMARSVPFLGNVMAVCSGTKGKIYLACGVVGAVLLLWAGNLLGKGREGI